MGLGSAAASAVLGVTSSTRLAPLVAGSPVDPVTPSASQRAYAGPPVTVSATLATRKKEFLPSGVKQWFAKWRGVKGDNAKLT